MKAGWKDMVCVCVLVGAAAFFYAHHERRSGVAWSGAPTDNQYAMAKICSKIMDARKTLHIVMEDSRSVSQSDLSRIERNLLEAESDMRSLMDKMK